MVAQYCVVGYFNSHHYKCRTEDPSLSKFSRDAKSFTSEFLENFSRYWQKLWTNDCMDLTK